MYSMKHFFLELIYSIVMLYGIFVIKILTFIITAVIVSELHPIIPRIAPRKNRAAVAVPCSLYTLPDDPFAVRY